MITKSLTSRSISVQNTTNDLSIIRRLLVAAAISPSFCSRLLENPSRALQSGFGGEKFHLSDSAFQSISTIQAASLGEFIQQVNKDFPIL